MLHVRFSLDPSLPPTTPDTPAVLHGTLDGDTVHAHGQQHPLSSVRLLPPCAPTKIVCVGRNYPEHARELGNEVPAEPLLFLKPPSSLIAHGDAILYPSLSQRVDFEGELGVVIGRRARHLTLDTAHDYVRGYTCVNDVTARDVQKRDSQWTRGKGFDTFCAVGPGLVPASDLKLSDLTVETYLDGQRRQHGFPRDMMFSVAAILAYVTQCMTLEPGDLIATGTPPGVGPMQPGQVVEVVIEGVGRLRNPVNRGE